MKNKWEVKKLEQVCDIISGRSQKAVECSEGPYPIYGSGGIMGYASDYLCESGATIIGRKGSINNPIYVQTKFWNVDTAFGMLPKPILNGKLFYYFCLSFDFSKMNKGTTIPSLVKKDLLQIDVPYTPSLPEQQRIVDILDVEFAKIDRLRSNAELNLCHAKDLFQAATEKELKDNGTLSVRMDEICDITSSLVNPQEGQYQNLLHVGGGNIESETGRLFDLKTANEEKLISGKFLFDETMVLYNKIRPYLKKVAKPDFKGLCSADMYPLKPKDICNREYLYYILLSKGFTDYAILGSARAGMPKVNREHLFAYTCKIPSIDIQKQIVATLDELDAKCKVLQDNYTKTIALCDDLKQALLRKAFNGEL